MKASNALGINWHTNMNNPTGIFANNGDVLYIMVEGEIKEGAHLYLESYTGHGKTVDDYTRGQQLQSGLNIIKCTADGSNYCINYIVETFDTSDGKRGNKAKARRLSAYNDLKIHIEGGYINGYYNKMGDALYTPDKNADWDYIAARATQTDVTILGERIVLQFPLNDADTEGNKGLGYYLTGKNLTEAVIDEWDNVMLWERLLLGVLGENTINAEAKQSPYSITQSKNVFEYTGKDGEFESDYSDYYNVHGLSFGVGGNSYMYGSGDHCGYHYNTMKSIIQELPTNAGYHWGPGHEIGHQHQALLTVNGLMEVTNNLFSNVVLWYFGETTSRYNGTEGALSNVLAQFNAEGTDFFSNNVWAQTIMYYKLFLYYHVLGHNPKFYPRLFEMLRQDPMSTGYAQDGSTCLMHFYKKCCLAAGEDLTEFFRAHGFFEVMDNRFVGDYSNSVYNLTQAQIDAAIKEIKDLGYKNNVSVLFVTDATGETIQSHKGDNLDLYGETQVCAELGCYANFNNNTASTYTATVSGTTVTMSGEGGVGFAILNKKGELIGFSDKKTFELSLDAVEAILNGEANFIVVNGNATTTPATIDGNVDERNKSLLGEMMEQIKEFTNYEDATGKKIGYYKSSSLASMKAALEKAQEVYDNEEKASYTAVFNALKQEYNAFIAADYNEIPMTAGTFILKNCSNNQHLYVNDKDSLALTNTAEANLENTAKWVFEKTGSGKYYIKNLSTRKYIGALAKDNNVPVLNTTGADAYDVVPMSNPGEFAIVYGDKVSFNTSWKGVIGWDYDGDRNSWWYITAVETDPADAQAVLLKELLDKTQALYDQMAVTPIPQVIPLTESSYFSNALQKGGAYPSDNFISYSVLCDGDPFTHFHSAYSGTNPGTHHYIRVDLGEEYKSDLFAFTYTNRSSNNRQNPTAITVEGSNEENGTYEDIVSLTTLDGLPTAEASSFESELLGTQGKAYRYLRFKVTETNSNAKFGDYPYFSITELGVLKGSFAITANSKYASNTITDAYMLEVFNALRQAKHDYRNATTADEYTDAYNALNTHYTTLLEAYNTVKDADLTAKKTELQTLINNTTTLIGQCGEVNYIPGTFDGEAPLQATNENSGFYLSTNAPEPNEGAIGNLLDADMNSYFHSAWSVDIEAEHYLLVDAGDGKELKDFTFSYQSNRGPFPYAIDVYGSNNNTEFIKLATFTKDDANNALPTSTDTRWTSSKIVLETAYRYLRFNVTNSGAPDINANPKGEYCFVMSDFDITAYGEEASYEVTVKAGDVTEDLLLATYKENQEAQSAYHYATTKEQVEKARAELQAQYDALKTAYNTLAPELQAAMEAAQTFLNATPQTVGYPSATQRNAFQTAIDAHESVEAINTAKTEFINTTDIVMPENGKAYKISAWWRNETRSMEFVGTENTSIFAGSVPAYVPTTSETATIFVCRDLGNGEYAFISDNGYYLGWQADGKKNNTSTSFSVNSYDNTLKVQKAVPNNMDTMLSSEEVFGTFNILGKNGNESGKYYHFMFKKSSKNYHSGNEGDAHYGDDAHTVFYTFEEVSSYTLNKVNLTATSTAKDKLLKGIADQQTISTFSAPYATVIPEGVTAYYATQEYDGNMLYLKAIQEGDALPANEGVILVGNVDVKASDFVPATTETVAVIDNKFSNSAAASVVMENNDYILANGNEGIGIYKAQAGTRLKQGKAFLRMGSTSNAPSFIMNFGGNATGVEITLTDGATGEQVVYDLYGRRVTEVTKGRLYIVNGKKVFIK